MHEIYVDADGCPVLQETAKVAQRYDMLMHIVANRYVNPPRGPRVQVTKVDAGFDAADDWIAERAGAGDIVITADIPLAARCLEAGARVLGNRGREFSEESIGDALASRALSDHLRQMGVQTGGPPPMDKKFRSRFLSKLDELANAVRRG